MNKTIIIAVENKYPHPIYGKTIKKTKRFMAHDEENNCMIGDVVRIIDGVELGVVDRILSWIKVVFFLRV